MDIETILNNIKVKYLSIINTQNEKIEILMIKIKKQNQRIQELMKQKNDVLDKNQKLNEKLSNFIIKYNEEKNKNESYNLSTTNNINNQTPKPSKITKRKKLVKRNTNFLWEAPKIITRPRFNSSYESLNILNTCLDLKSLKNRLNTNIKWNGFFLIENILQVGPSYNLKTNLENNFQDKFNFIGDKKFKDHSIIRFINSKEKQNYETYNLNSFDDIEEALFQSDTSFYHFAINSDIFVENLKKNEIIYKTNKELFQYYYCLELKDFLFDDDLTKIYVFKKYLIIKSYYCMTNFFKKLLYSIKEYIKGIKYDLFLEAKENKISFKEKNNFYKNIMYSNFNESILKDIYLKNLYINDIKNNFFFDYDVKDEDLLLQEICIDKINILNFINFNDFLFLFLYMLHDNSILIISSNIYKVTQLIGLLLRCLKPFNFPFPIIYILPHKLLEMIESPVNILLGLNMSKNEFFKKVTKEKINSKKNFIIYNIDENEFYGDLNSISEINLFNIEFINSIKKEFYFYNKTKSKQIDIINNKFKYIRVNSLENKITDAKDTKFLINFINYINIYFKNILKEFKKQSDIVIKNDRINNDLLNNIINVFEKDSMFLTNFFKSQIFIYHIEKKYN